MTTQHPAAASANVSTLDVLSTMTFLKLDDVLELFERTAKSVNSSAAGLYLTGQRDRAPFFGRVASQLRELRSAIIAWRDGNAPANFDLVLALEENLLAIEEAYLEFSTQEARLQDPHRILTSMLLQLKPRSLQPPNGEVDNARGT
jgi:hypothetical protein